MKAPLNPDRESFLAFARAARAAGAKRAPFAVRIANDRWLAPAVFDEWQKRARFAFLLESAEVGEAGRYSILGADPEAVMTFADGEATIVDREGRKSAGAGADPLAALAAFLPPKAAAPFENLPPFFGGVVGYLGYDSARHYEPVGAPKSDPIQIPETLWMRADLVAVFDHLKSEIYLICNCAVDGDVDAVFDLARARVERFFAEGFGFRRRRRRRWRRKSISSVTSRRAICRLRISPAPLSRRSSSPPKSISAKAMFFRSCRRSDLRSRSPRRLSRSIDGCAATIRRLICFICVAAISRWRDRRPN